MQTKNVFLKKKFEFFKAYENINSNEKFDNEKLLKSYFYNFHSKLSNVCKKCNKLKKKISIMFFIVTFVVVQKKNH